MAKPAARMLRETIRKAVIHTVIEWDLNQEEAVGALELVKLDLWNEWDDITDAFSNNEDDDD